MPLDQRCVLPLEVSPSGVVISLCHYNHELFDPLSRTGEKREFWLCKRATGIDNKHEHVGALQRLERDLGMSGVQAPHTRRVSDEETTEERQRNPDVIHATLRSFLGLPCSVAHIRRSPTAIGMTCASAVWTSTRSVSACQKRTKAFVAQSRPRRRQVMSPEQRVHEAAFRHA